MFSGTWCKMLCPHMATIWSWPHNHHMVMTTDCSQLWIRETSIHVCTTCILNSVFRDKVLVFVCLLRWICWGNCVLPFSVAASSAVPVNRCVVRTHNAWCETGHHILLVSWYSVISQETKNRSAMQFWNIRATSAMLSKTVQYIIKSTQSNDNQCDLLSLNRTAGQQPEPETHPKEHQMCGTQSNNNQSDLLSLNRTAGPATRTRKTPQKQKSCDTLSYNNQCDLLSLNRTAGQRPEPETHPKTPKIIFKHQFWSPNCKHVYRPKK